jgi:branched-chain amino acid transport system permease protein
MRSGLAIRRGLKALLALVTLIAVLSLPFVTGAYYLRLGTEIVMYVALVLSWNLLAGYVGYLSFGHAVFFGLGGYTAALAGAKYGIPFPLALLLGALVVAAFAFLVGLPVLGLRGHYFALATLGVAEATFAIFANWDFVGGTRGLYAATGAANQAFYYFMMLAIALLALGITWWVDRRSSLGYAFRAIREDEVAARATGIRAVTYKQLAFVVSAGIAGLVGGVYAYWFSYITPEQMFSVEISLLVIAMALLGGTGTVWGPVLGAVVLRILSEAVWANFLTLSNLVFGIVIIVVVLFIPQGLVRYLHPATEQLRSMVRGSTTKA